MKHTDKNKLRYDLIPNHAVTEIAKVMTYGCNKYSDREWEKGDKWSNIQAKIDRHWNAHKSGEDYDDESGQLHISLALTNMAILTEYHKIYPQGDNRSHRYLKPPRIGLDIDEVLADWLKAWCEKHNITEPVYFWNFDSAIKERFAEMANDKDFWVNIPPKILAKDLPFEPACYITSRSIPKEWTEEWLKINGFPSVPLYSIGFNKSKVDTAKEANIDWFVDDRYENFVELNEAGICTFLMDCPHNHKYNVGYKRIYSLNDLKL